MIFMDIVSWDPENTEAVGKCYEAYEYPEGIKVIDEWIDLMGYRIFVIYELEDEKAYLTSNLPFMGLCKFETLPLMRASLYEKTYEEWAKKTGIRPEFEKKAAIQEKLKNLEKRVQRLEQQTFIQQEDIT
ncbi:MAG: hypothetical protein PHD41_04035 [Methanosarcinaceae archaeon]|nr:hypothetical protein [Methanosarcinaceae archaeon]MDD4749341.1 hypothetical protein [Methanosarcinaceae archaeon]